MAFHSLADFFAMGGYAFYVWTAYGICFVLLTGYVLLLRHQRKALRRRIQQLALREASLRDMS